MLWFETIAQPPPDDPIDFHVWADANLCRVCGGYIDDPDNSIDWATRYYNEVGGITFNALHAWDEVPEFWFDSCGCNSHDINFDW